MGLRERNAAQTREAILETALPLFLEQGYDATTMEEIAERAQVGLSTLYRYFPSKEMLVVDPIALRGQMSAELRSRPADEPLDVALGHAVRTILTTPRASPARMRQLNAIIESALGPRARLLESFFTERVLLEQAVAERLGRPADDIFCIITARLATVVLELAAQLAQDSTDDPAEAERRVVEAAKRVTDLMHTEPPAIPRLVD